MVQHIQNKKQQPIIPFQNQKMTSITKHLNVSGGIERGGERDT